MANNSGGSLRRRPVREPGISAGLVAFVERRLTRGAFGYGK